MKRQTADIYRRLRPIVWALLCSFLFGCGPTAYLRATGAYATAIEAGTGAFDVEFKGAVNLCQRRAQLDRVRHLIEGSDDGNVNWSEHCDEVRRGVELHQAALDTVTAYAEALHKLADGADYKGDGPKDLGSAAQTLVGTFAGGSSKEAEYAAAVGPPLQLLAGFVLNQYATAKTKDAIKDSGGAVAAVLGALHNYLKGSEFQLVAFAAEVKKLTEDSAKRMRETSPGRKVPPVDAWTFVREAEAWSEEVVVAQDRHKALGGAMDKLEAAQAKLQRAGERDQEELDSVIKSAIEVGKAVKPFLGNALPPKN